MKLKMKVVTRNVCKVCGYPSMYQGDSCAACMIWALRVGTERWPASRSVRVNEQIREYLLDNLESTSYVESCKMLYMKGSANLG